MTTERIKRLQEADTLLYQATELLSNIETVLPDDYNLFFTMYSPATEDAKKSIEYLHSRVHDELEKLEAEVSA